MSSCSRFYKKPFFQMHNNNLEKQISNNCLQNFKQSEVFSKTLSSFSTFVNANGCIAHPTK